MRAALETPDPARLWVIHPGEHAYRMTENIIIRSPAPSGKLLGRQWRSTENKNSESISEFFVEWNVLNGRGTDQDGSFTGKQTMINSIPSKKNIILTSMTIAAMA